jgi:hypothetical protein
MNQGFFVKLSLTSENSKRLMRAVLSAINIALIITIQLYVVVLLGIGQATDFYYSLIVLPQFISLIQTIYFQNIFVPQLSQRQSDYGYEKAILMYSLKIASFLAFVFLFGSLAFSYLVLGSKDDFEIYFVASLLIIVNAAGAPLIAISYAREHFSIVELSSIGSGIIVMFYRLRGGFIVVRKVSYQLPAAIVIRYASETGRAAESSTALANRVKYLPIKFRTNKVRPCCR